MIGRRRFVQALSAAPMLAALSEALAAVTEPVHVVKFLLFSCPICRATDGMDPALRIAAQKTGGRFIQAPLPMDADFAAQFYYAARDISSEAESRVRLSLYKGVQDMGIPMNDSFRVMVWLQQDLGDLKLDWPALMRAAAGSEVQSTLGRSARLASSMGVTNTPSYVLVKGNNPSSLLDPTSVTPRNSLSTLREAVLKKVNELS